MELAAHPLNGVARIYCFGVGREATEIIALIDAKTNGDKNETTTANVQNEFGALRSNPGIIAENALTKSSSEINWKCSLALGRKKMITDVTRFGSNHGQYFRIAAPRGRRSLCGAMDKRLATK
jgi:hypothetical protein